VKGESMKNKESEKIELLMELEKETKNTYRYAVVQEGGKPPAVRTVYIEKWAVPSHPDKIKLTVEVI